MKKRQNKKLFFILIIAIVILFALALTVFLISETKRPSLAPLKENTFAPSGAFVSDQLLVGWEEGVTDNKKMEAYQKSKISVVSSVPQINMDIIYVPTERRESVENTLKQNPNVRAVEKNLILPPALVPNDPRFNSTNCLTDGQYNLIIIHAPEAWNISTGNSEVIVAAPDSGVRITHQDLQNILLLDLAYNTVLNNSNVTDINGHGTAVAGAYAETNNSLGIASMAWNKQRMIPVKLVSNDTSGGFSQNEVIEAIVYAADNNAKAVSISSGFGCSLLVADTGGYLRGKGGLLFISAGNANLEVGCENLANIIVVSGTNESDTKWSGSNYGNFTDIAAPAHQLQTTGRSSDSSYACATGTSNSAPLAASVAAYLFSVFPNATPDQVEQALYQGAVDKGTPGWDEYYGWGRVDALGSLTIIMDQFPFCGNGIIEGDEECDGDDLNGEDCISQGFDGGELSCNSDCTFDTTNCYNNPDYTCDDTDGGKYPNVKGWVSGYYEGDEFSYTDICVNSTRVNEYYCDGDYSNSIEEDCPSGYECKQGACKAKATQVTKTVPQLGPETGEKESFLEKIIDILGGLFSKLFGRQP